MRNGSDSNREPESGAGSGAGSGTGGGPRERPWRRDRNGSGGQGDLGSVLQFGISIIVFTLAGSWLDTRLGTAPVLLVAGMCIGTAAGFYSMYRKLTERERRASGGGERDREDG